MAITNSIVDYLNSQGKDSSYAARKKLAAEYGMQGYSGTAAQNTNLLNALRNNTAQTGNTGTVTPEPQTGSSVSPNVTAGTTNTQPDYKSQLQTLETSKPASYKESERVTGYYNQMKDLESEKPGAFKSQYEAEIDSILESILNNKEFSYNADDLANDNLYQMYKDNYMRQGNLAMRDVMGNAASLTGGYGSTYAAFAGQQAYDNYLAQLNNKALEFADRAYDQYLNEQAERYNKLGAVQGLDNTDYNRYRDEVGDYYTDLNYAAGRYDSEYAKDYGSYRDSIGDYQTDRNYLANMRQWADEFAFQKAQADQDQANWQAEMDFAREQFNYQKSKAGSGGGGSYRGTGKEAESEEKSLDDYTYYDFVQRLQQLKDEGKAGEVEAFNIVEDWYLKGYITLEEMDEILMATNTTGYNTKTAKGVMS